MENEYNNPTEKKDIQSQLKKLKSNEEVMDSYLEKCANGEFRINEEYYGSNKERLEVVLNSSYRIVSKTRGIRKLLDREFYIKSDLLIKKVLSQLREGEK